VTLSYDAWKDGQVAPTTHTVLVVQPPALNLEPVSPRLVKTLIHPDRNACVPTVRFFASGTKLFAAGYPSGVVQVFDLASGSELCRIETPPGYRGTADYAISTPDFRTLYVPVDRCKDIVFEKDGKKQYRCQFNGELLAWDLATGKELPAIAPSASERGVLRGYMSPVGNKIVTVERASYTPDEDIVTETLLWDLTNNTAKLLGKGYGMSAFSHDGKRLATALFRSQTEAGCLTVTDLEAGRVFFTTKATAEGRGFSLPTFSPDGKILAIQHGAGRIDRPATIRLYDAEAGKELGSFDSGGPYPFMEETFSPDGKQLAAPDYHGGLTVWNVSRKQVEWSCQLNGLQACRRAVFSPDSKRLAILGWPKVDPADLELDVAEQPQARLFLFDRFGTGEPEIIICPQGYCEGLEFSPDGKTLAVGGTGGVHLFDVTN